jgi:hypothetical protein
MKTSIQYSHLQSALFCLALTFGLAFSGAQAHSQEPARLALPAVRPASTLAKRLARPEPAARPTESPIPQVAPRPSSAGLLGHWVGTSDDGDEVVLTITRASAQTLHAQWQNVAQNSIHPSSPIIANDAHLRMTIRMARGVATVEGALDADSGKLLLTLTHRNQTKAYEFRRDQLAAQARPSVAPTPAPLPKLGLDDVLHAVEAQLVDALSTTKMFHVVEDRELRNALGIAEGEADDLRDIKSAALRSRFEKASIPYLLVTTVEDFLEETLAGTQEKKQQQQRDFDIQQRRRLMLQQYQQQRRYPNGAPLLRQQGEFDNSISGSYREEQTQSAARESRLQRLRLSVRYRLYRATTGELLRSEDRSFITNRAYSVVASGGQSLQANDLLEQATKRVAEQAVVLVGEAVFPIRVLEKSGKEVTINRGRETGLRVGQRYKVSSLGKEIVDPGTKEVLGRDEVTEGVVEITELNDKFSKARVVEDRNITPGCILRAAR